MRLIDADAAKKDCIEALGEESNICRTVGLVFCEILDRQSTIDTVSVVRCKDCKYYEVMENCFKKDGAPIHFCSADFGLAEFLNDNDYCSRGKKKGA